MTLSFQNIYIHIGKHKTGSSSFQMLLEQHSDQLEQQGIAVLPWRLSNLIAAVAVRDNLPIPPRIGSQLPSIEQLRQTINQYLQDKPHHTHIVSSEHLSYFRTTEELIRLKYLLPKAEIFKVFL